jgi:hypothetical protein
VVNDASYVLLDVTARPTMHPNDLKNAVLDLIGKEGFGIVDAADGYILLRRGEAQTDLPDAFFSAFRTDSPRPQYQVEVDFGPGLRLLGYDVESVDEGRQRWMRTRLYWLVKSDLPADLRIWPFVLDQSGQVIEDTTQRPLAATLWYPPERWQQGEVIRMETLPWPLGNEFRLAVGALRGTDWSNRGSRLPAQLVQTSAPVRRLDEGTAVEIGHLRWARLFGFWRLEQEKPASPAPQVRLDARFGNQIKLLGYDLAQGQAPLAPGQSVAITLYWQALARPSQDYHTFAHVYDNAGKVAAQSDGVTGDDQPSSWWFPAQVYTETRTITLPAVIPDAPSVSIGLYLLETQERLPVVGRDGKAQGDTVKISLR